MKGSNVAAFFIGALAGGVVALLYAPQSGRKTRRQVREFVEDEVDQVKDFADRTVYKAKTAVNQGVAQVREGVSQARRFVQDEMADGKSELCDCEGDKKQK